MMEEEMREREDKYEMKENRSRKRRQEEGERKEKYYIIEESNIKIEKRERRGLEGEGKRERKGG